MRKEITVAILSILCLAQLSIFVSAKSGNITLSLKYNNIGGTIVRRNTQKVCVYNEENFYGTPVVYDLDKDGTNEIIYSDGSITVVDAVTGEIEWRINSGSQRGTAYKVGANAGTTFNDVIVKDIDNDGDPEIISGHGGGLVSVLDKDGYFEPGWPKQISTGYCSGLAAGDVDGDGYDEIAVVMGKSDVEAIYLLDYLGNIMDGWPQLSYDQSYHNNSSLTSGGGYTYGVFKGGVALTDLDGDGDLEILVPTDTAFLSAFHHTGKLCTAGSDVFGNKTWAEIGVFLDGNSDQNLSHTSKWGAYYLTEDDPLSLRYHAELGHSVITVEDLDGDGEEEIIFSGIIVDSATDFDRPTDLYKETQFMTFFILNKDRTRYTNEEPGFDWTVSPGADVMGTHLLDDVSLSLASEIESSPVCADLDGDGIKEILINTYDGKLHCFGLDSTTSEYGNFPYTLNSSSEVVEYASEPSCVDINGDGKLEIIFATLTRRADGNTVTGQRGRLIILDNTGEFISEIELPEGYVVYETLKEEKTNMCKSGVTVADLDSDGQYEIALASVSGGLCVYDITATHCLNDVCNYQWFYDNIEYCSHMGYVSGVKEGYFYPDDSVTRAQFVTMLAKLSGVDLTEYSNQDSGFSDVKNEQWFHDAVTWASKNGYAQGMGNGKFLPDEKITREQLARFFYAYGQLTGLDVSDKADLSKYSDASSIGAWAYDSVAWCVKEGIMNGISTTKIAPSSTAMRAQAATMLRVFDTIKD